jgi:demethylmenaquinone methyltransferase/2-methoxy-6-polyprenyl-1,4-benzoquinol methylase
MSSDLVSYYRERAHEYDSVYQKPERQADLAAATQLLQRMFRGLNVLEIACGTGYWTERIAQTASSISAIDINESMLAIARARQYPADTVTFQAADLFSLPQQRSYDALFGGFIWSHILLQELSNFCDIISNLVRPGGLLVFMDNRHVPGSNLPIASTDEAGNTYQSRKLINGNEYSIVKNFPSHSFIQDTFRDRATDFQFISLQYYWIAQASAK